MFNRSYISYRDYSSGFYHACALSPTTISLFLKIKHVENLYFVSFVQFELQKTATFPTLNGERIDLNTQDKEFHRPPKKQIFLAQRKIKSSVK